MDTKSEKMRALTCETTLVSLVIEDIFQDKADERTVNLLRLLAGRSEGVVWKEISLSELKARFAFYRDCFEDEVLALLQEFMNFTAALEADDMTDDFVIEAAPMLVAVGGWPNISAMRILKRRLFRRLSAGFCCVSRRCFLRRCPCGLSEPCRLTGWRR